MGKIACFMDKGSVKTQQFFLMNLNSTYMGRTVSEMIEDIKMKPIIKIAYRLQLNSQIDKWSGDAYSAKKLDA